MPERSLVTVRVRVGVQVRAGFWGSQCAWVYGWGWGWDSGWDWGWPKLGLGLGLCVCVVCYWCGVLWCSSGMKEAILWGFCELRNLFHLCQI